VAPVSQSVEVEHAPATHVPVAEQMKPAPYEPAAVQSAVVVQAPHWFVVVLQIWPPVHPGAVVPVVERHVAATQLDAIQSEPGYAAWQAVSEAAVVAPFASHAWQVHVASLTPFKPAPVEHAPPTVQPASASGVPPSSPPELVVLDVLEDVEAPLVLAPLVLAPLVLAPLVLAPLVLAPEVPEVLVELVLASGMVTPLLSSPPQAATQTALATSVTTKADPLRRPILDIETFLSAHAIASCGDGRRKFPGAPQQTTHHFRAAIFRACFDASVNVAPST
jgi:hypothetical protein